VKHKQNGRFKIYFAEQGDMGSRLLAVVLLAGGGIKSGGQLHLEAVCDWVPWTVVC
jgi:hypothetical protein